MYPELYILVFRGRGRGGRGGRRFNGFNNNRRSRDSTNTPHIHNTSNQHLALKIAEDHQCNNLSFETKDPTTASSRLYIGNISKKHVTRPDLFVIFSKYGTITAISHLTCKGPMDHCCYAFVQYTTTEAAEKAVKDENGKGYYGYTLGK